MSYVFESLEAIAALLERNAADVEDRATVSTDETYKAVSMGQSSGLKVAAHILRRTTITEPIHMEKQ